MKCQNCGSISQVRDLYDGLCFTCAWPNNVTTADPKHATTMEAEMSRVTIGDVAASIREYLDQRAMHLSSALLYARPQPMVVAEMDVAVKCSRPRCTNDAMLPLQSNGDGWLCRGHAGQPLVGPLEAKYERQYSCAKCGSGMNTTAARASLFCDACQAKPPTLREWLGDRVSELGPWAGVLREQPVACGFVSRCEWRRVHGQWDLFLYNKFDINPIRLRASSLARVLTNAELGAIDTYRMALFTRHPAVKPEPAPLRTWFGNEEEP